MSITIALAGNPNCGKTTLFNALTGSNQFVGNWPGVTVEKKEGKLKKHHDVTVMDLPGIYSLSPYTLEEVVARNYLIGERPDIILNLVDGTNLERNLYLTTQLTELGIPVVIAVNMMDAVRKNGDKINIDELSRQMGCPVCEISALKNEGIMEAAELAIRAAGDKKPVPNHKFSGVVEHAIAHIEEVTVHDLPEEQQRWYAIKLFERDEKVLEQMKLSDSVRNHIERDIAAAEAEMDDDAESIITNERYIYIGEVIKSCLKKANKGNLTTSDKIDRVVTNRFLALPIFAVIMFLVYYVSVTTVGTMATDWMNDTLFGEIVPSLVENLLNVLQVSEEGIGAVVRGVILDGIVAGVGAVLGFVPQILILFIFLAFLEACGYMARIAFVLDRIFRKFGLSGKSFIPVLIGTGCVVPGIMASRTIENERDRRMTIMTTTFIPCGAKLPFIAMIAGAVFGGAAWVAPLAYFSGMAAIIISGIMLKKMKMFAGDPAPFVMELPAYHMPTLGNVLRSMWERGWSFIKKAGTIILLSTIVIWFATYFGFAPDGFRMLEEEEIAYSLLASAGKVLQVLFIPLGWGIGHWQATVATITGLVAKENIVGTLGILYNVGETESVYGNIAMAFSAASGLSFLLFNLLCAPCFAAMGAIKREMNNRKWFWFAIGYECGFAYVVALIVYQVAAIFEGSANVLGLIVAAVLLGLMIFQLFRKEKKA